MLSTETTQNKSGATAFALSTRGTLAQLAVTGMLPSNQKTNDILVLAGQCPAEFVAKLAVYTRQCGFIRDSSVLLLAHLATREDKTWFHKAFPHVVDNVGQARKFVKIMRSGKVGRKSLGSAAKRALQNFFKDKTAGKLFWQAQGTDPSIADVIHLVHPRPDTAEKDALFAYFVGRDYVASDLPRAVQAFEKFKSGEADIVPDVPFLRLTSLDLTPEQWDSVFRKMTWNQLRFNLATAARKGLFKDSKFTGYVVAKLRDPEQVRRQKVVPFALLTTIQTLVLNPDIPKEVIKSLVTALEITLENAPTIPGSTVIIDVSGSMSSYRVTPGKNTRPVSVIEVAALFASAWLKANPDADVVLVDTAVHTQHKVSGTRPFMENVQYLAQYRGGGTRLGAAFQHIAEQAKAKGEAPSTVIMLSDNESWVYGNTRFAGYHGTECRRFWNDIRNINPSAKLVCWNMMDGMTSQLPDEPGVMNLGGWTDTAFDMIEMFSKASSDTEWCDIIDRIEF